MTAHPPDDPPTDNLMQRALGADWSRLPAALQAHYLPGPAWADGAAMDVGHMDVSYPIYMQPVLTVLSWLGALVPRRAQNVATLVVRRAKAGQLHWQRTLTFPDGRIVRFNSVWEPGAPDSVIEFVNPALGLEMAPHVQDGRLRYEGRRFVARIGRWRLSLPEWLLGHTTIEEAALDDRRFQMDFRMTHPLLGEVFRYKGTFEANVPHKG